MWYALHDDWDAIAQMLTSRRLYATAQNVPARRRIVDLQSRMFITIRGSAYQSERLFAVKTRHERIHTMLYTIAVVLIILWLLGLVTSTTMGGFIHILLVIAVVVILINLISGRKSL